MQAIATQHWSQEIIIEEILRLNAQHADLRHSEVSTHHQRLVGAAVRYFGSWGAAVTAAGIDYASIRKRSQDARASRVTKWSLKEIAERIKALADSGEFLAAARIRASHPALFSAAVSPRYFGSWRNAVTAVGLDYDAILKHNRSSSTAPRDARGMKTVMRRLHVLGEDAMHLTSAEAQSRYPQLYQRAAKHFGSWEAALDATQRARKPRPALKAQASSEPPADRSGGTASPRPPQAWSA